MKLYRAALHCYPRAFRHEYGDDMVSLLEAQLRDERGARVVGRAALDFLVTVPTTHLEHRMSRATAPTLVIVLVALGVVVAAVGGPVGILAALVAFALAAITWRRGQPIVTAVDGRWWKFLASGAGLLAVLIVVTTITGELPSGGWYVAMVTMLTSFVLIATGVVLGLAARIRSV
jgi:hypothetical protein